MAATEPQDPQALYREAVALARAGRLEESLACFNRFIEHDPAHWDARASRVYLLQVLGRVEAALGDYEALVSLQPANAHAWNDYAAAMHRLGRAEEALALYARALGADPKHLGALVNRAGLLLDLERHEEALATFDAALAVEPAQVEALISRGTALHALGRLDEAIASVDAALRLQPAHARGLSNRASIMFDLGRFEEGMANVEASLALDPDNPDALTNRASLLHGMGRFDEALAGFDRVIALAPRHAQAHAGRAAVLQDLDRPAEGLASADASLALMPDHPLALNNRGTLLFQLGRVDEALAALDRSMALAPARADAAFNKALALLSLGRYREGWALYERRFGLAFHAHHLRRFSQPRWTGAQDVRGKRVLVHAEQGMGDILQFCRYLPLLADRGAEVIAEVPRTLAALVATVDPRVRVVADDEPLPPHDFCVAVMSLPFAMGTTVDTVPARTPYLFADAAKAAAWRERLGAKSRPRIGLAWSGAGINRKNVGRSIPLELLAPLFARDVEVHALQTEFLARDRAALATLPVHRHEGELRDFSDTAALVDAMDLVISVDTSVAHLAGALGKPVWILLPFVAEFRWMAGTATTPWYPTARLFRQPGRGDWAGVVRDLVAALD